jgi:anti-sigma B factor antagonist
VPTVVVDGRRRIVLDLSQLKFLGAAGLTVFCVTTGRLRTLGGRLRLTALPARMRRILQITGLDDLLGQPVAGPSSRRGSVAPAPASA